MLLASLRRAFECKLTEIGNTGIPAFSASSSRELDEALGRFREELFIPFGLSLRQRRLMFRQRYAKKLAEEPVTVMVTASGRSETATEKAEEEPFQLRPMDATTSPSNSEAAGVVSLMKTAEDWQKNLVPFLQGLRMARRTVSAARWEWMVRKAADAGALGVILECAKQSDRTGLRLTSQGVVQRIFFALHRSAQAADFKGPETAKALSLASQFALLLNSPAHQQRAAAAAAAADPRRMPLVVGVLLELSAARALDEFGGADGDGSVRSYCRRLLAASPAVAVQTAGPAKSASAVGARIDQWLQNNVPVLHAMRLAMLVHGVAADKALGEPLAARIAELDGLVAQARAALPAEFKQRPSVGYEQSMALHG